VLFSVVVLLPLSGALLVVVVLVDFCVTSGDGDASAPGEVSVVVVVVVSFVGPWHPTIIVPAMKAKTVTAASETIYFEIFMGREYQNSMILHGAKAQRNHWVPMPKARDLVDLNAQLLAACREVVLKFLTINLFRRRRFDRDGDAR